MNHGATTPFRKSVNKHIMETYKIFETYYATGKQEYVKCLNDSVVVLTGKFIFTVFIESEYVSFPAETELSFN